MKRKLQKLLSITIALITLGSSLNVFASSAAMDPSFKTGIPNGFDGAAGVIGVQTDGKIIMGGLFSTYQGVAANNIIRLNSDGSRDTSFEIGSGFNGSVEAIAIQPDGKILVAGEFYEYYGPNSGICDDMISLDQTTCENQRACSDGVSTDQTTCENRFFCSDASKTDQNSCEATQCYNATGLDQNTCEANGGIRAPNGRWGTGDRYKLGYKWNKNITRAYGLIRLNSDGSVDNSFSSLAYSSNGNMYGGASILHILDNGQILIGGHGRNGQDYLYKLNSDGSIDNSFSGGGIISIETFDGTSVTNGLISSDANIIQPDGKIIRGGFFTSYNGTSSNNIVRLNADGTVDSGFNIGSGFDNIISSIALQPNGKIIVAGNFTKYKGVVANGFIRLNSDGSIDNSFNAGTGGWTQGGITLQPDGKIFICNIGRYKNIQVNDIIRLNADGSVDNSFHMPADSGGSYKAILQPDGKIFVIGFANVTYDGMNTNGILKLNSDGSRDSSFGIQYGLDNTITTIGIQPDAKIIIAGNFSLYEGKKVKHIIRLNADGSVDNSFDIGSGMAYDGQGIESIVIQADGKILVGGSFEGKLIRLNSDGSKDNSFTLDSNFDQSVCGMILQPDEKIIIQKSMGCYGFGTDITRVNSDGSKDNSFNIEAGFSSSIYTEITSIAIQSDGKFIIGGQFDTYKGTSVKNIIRLNSDGTIDNSFNAGAGFNDIVTAIAIQSDEKILVGGIFSKYQGTDVSNIIRLNSDGSRDTSFDIGIPSIGQTIAIFPKADGNIIVGGKAQILQFSSTGSLDTSFANVLIGNNIVFDGRLNAIGLRPNGQIIIGGTFNSYNGQAAAYLTALYGDSDTVMLPNTTNTNEITSAFTTKGYTTNSGVLYGSTPISLSDTNGNIPTDLNISNAGIRLNITNNSQFTTDSGVNYKGIIAVPNLKSATSIADMKVLSAFKVGSTSNNIILLGDVATISVPITGKNIGDMVQIYYSQDNGATWYPETTTTVIDYNNTPTVSFKTNHFTEFAVLESNAIGTINYSTTTTTDQDVVVTVNLTNGSITSPGGNTHTFTENGTFKFSYITPDNIVRTIPVTVGWINKNNTGTNNTGTNNTEDTTPHNGGSVGGGGGFISHVIDKIKDFLDPTETNKTETGEVKPNPSIVGSVFTPEINNAYVWAYQFNITTKPSIQEANIEGQLTRKDMAKMISNFAINVLKKPINTGTNCTFSDTKQISNETDTYAQTACKLGLMGYNSDGQTVKKTFDPTAEVTRAQFGTILSRLLYGDKNNGGNIYYEKHLDALKKAGIITKNIPLQKEVRGYVMLMLMRAAK